MKFQCLDPGRSAVAELLINKEYFDVWNCTVEENFRLGLDLAVFTKMMSFFKDSDVLVLFDAVSIIDKESLELGILLRQFIVRARSPVVLFRNTLFVISLTAIMFVTGILLRQYVRNILNCDNLFPGLILCAHQLITRCTSILKPWDVKMLRRSWNELSTHRERQKKT